MAREREAREQPGTGAPGGARMGGFAARLFGNRRRLGDWPGSLCAPGSLHGGALMSNVVRLPVAPAALQAIVRAVAAEVRQD
ncbi:hypothetical protein IMZ48_35380 [Candidatus Bathyarchaeota archaeon]|nr:hypothetical protein [Candidatus Bathyarchaeota archaeon]